MATGESNANGPMPKAVPCFGTLRQEILAIVRTSKRRATDIRPSCCKASCFGHMPTIRADHRKSARSSSKVFPGLPEEIVDLNCEPGLAIQSVDILALDQDKTCSPFVLQHVCVCAQRGVHIHFGPAPLWTSKIGSQGIWHTQNGGKQGEKG